MAYDLSNMKVKNGQNWTSPNEIHKIANNYYLYAPVGASGGLAIKDGVPYQVTITSWSNEVPTITLGEPLSQIGTNKSSISSLQTTVNDKAIKSEAIKSISRNGTTFTATRCDNSTFTFTQQDNDTTYRYETDIDKMTFSGAASGYAAIRFYVTANQGVMLYMTPKSIYWQHFTGTEGNADSTYWQK